MERILTLSGIFALIGCASVRGEAPAEAAKPAGSGTSVQVEVQRAAGIPPQRVQALLAPSLAALHQCAPGSGGKINVRIAATEGRVHVAIEPGASLDPTLRECVLQALWTLDAEDREGDAPGARPLGFTSLVAVSW